MKKTPIKSLLAAILLLLVSTPATLAGSPTATVVAPSNEVGDAGAALGNVWDMDSPADIVFRQPDAGGARTSYTLNNSLPDTYGNAVRGVTPKGSDLASAFYTDSDLSIPGNVYRYLLYRVSIANHTSGESGLERTNGRVLYASNWGTESNWLFTAFPERRFSKPYVFNNQPDCPYGGWCLLFFDLAQDINSENSPNPWDWGQSGAEIKAFGIWPHENWANSSGGPSGDSPDFFYLDYVYLTGEIVTSQPPASSYLVRWNVSDADGGPITSTLYYQERDELLTPANAPTCDAGLSGWTPIPGGTSSLNLPTASFTHQLYLPLILKPAVPDSGSPFGSGQISSFNQSFVWDLSSGSYITGKVYYVCVEVEDGDNNKSYAVSSAPVIKVPAFTTLQPSD
ncbi:MAG: hypothetical protein KDF65_13055 [Anaerolineae bacterium]|nr:hypothetical protein [Anaerolineae bacterium]